MSKKLRVLSLVMATLMILSVFAGCKKKEVVEGSSGVIAESEVITEVESGAGDEDEEVASKVTSKKETDNTKSQTTSTKSQAAGTTNTNKIKVEKTGFPIIKGQTLKMQIMGVSKPGYADPKDMSFFKYYNKLTGIEMEYVGIADNTVTERTTLALQSGDVPAAFKFYHNTFSDFQISKYADEGMFIDLKKDIKTYAPNIQKLVTKKGVELALNQSSDGKIYTLPGKLATTVDYSSHYLNINKKWLDNLGLDVPKTTAEFLEVLRAFRDDDPNENGQNDEIPFALWNWSAKFIYSFFGIHMEDKTGIGLDQTGKAYFAHTLPGNARSALEYWNLIYTESKDQPQGKGGRLMDTTIVGASDGFYSAFRKQVNEGKVGCFWWSYFNSTYIDKDLVDDYIPIPYPTSGLTNAQYKLPGAAQPYNSVPTKGSFIVTKKCPSVPAILRYMDYLYTDEGIMLSNYGPESEGLYKKNTDGSYTLTEKGTDENAKKVAPISLLGPSTITMEKKLIVPTTEDAVYNNYVAKANEVYEKAHKENKVVYFTDFQKTADEIISLRKFEYFWDKGGYASRYVNGADKLTDYTSWVNDMNQKGLPQYIKIYQAVVDRNKQYIVK